MPFKHPNPGASWKEYDFVQAITPYFKKKTKNLIKLNALRMKNMVLIETFKIFKITLRNNKQNFSK